MTQETFLKASMSISRVELTDAGCFNIRWGNSVILQENKIELYQEIHLLPEQEREAVLYRISGELSFREIGEIMGKSENWSRTVFFRAKQKIRKEISKNE